ncbi:hypothetical protein [Mesorhizobium sp. WSM4884]|uniref:hypothetical protein n=1 Tax=Mesorhizobium sp. WSM4884 TaxID=3038542 RepID=UPI0024170422|nr:hypothetical protein [Mesorhizobium sp. WSM4884]MDG4882795.1 hypothetical protein [Mesorhizobium sp. WSM4884]
MSLDGRVLIDLFCDGGAVFQARVQPARAVVLGPIVTDRSAAEAIAAVASLFSVCGMAQAAAGVEAVEAALGIDTDLPTETARRLLVLAETLREHLVRIGLDVQRLTDAAPEAALLRRAMTLPVRLRKALFPDGDPFEPGARAGVPGSDADRIAAEAAELTCAMVHVEAGRLCEMNAAAFAAWASDRGTAAARLAYPILARGWAMIGCPKAKGEGVKLQALADTTCLARQAGEPLVRAFLSAEGEGGLGARLVARFVEAAKLPGEISAGLAVLRGSGTHSCGLRGEGAPKDRMGGSENTEAWHSSSPASRRLLPAHGEPNAFSGIGYAEAARGRLEHRVVLCEGRVVGYAVDAPTSSHFGENGIAERSLAALAAPSRAELALQADLLVRAIDPCVGYQVRFH